MRTFVKVFLGSAGGFIGLLSIAAVMTSVPYVAEEYGDLAGAAMIGLGVLIFSLFVATVITILEWSDYQ